MSDVKSYVGFKREALKALPLGVGQINRSGSHWSVTINGEWAGVSGHYYVGHPMTVKEFCDDLVAGLEAEEWNEAHTDRPTHYPL